MPDGIGSEERNYWCEEDRFKSILDSVCTFSTEVPIEITFDDGNISDAVVCIRRSVLSLIKRTKIIALDESATVAPDGAEMVSAKVGCHWRILTS